MIRQLSDTASASLGTPAISPAGDSVQSSLIRGLTSSNHRVTPSVELRDKGGSLAYTGIGCCDTSLDAPSFTSERDEFHTPAHTPSMRARPVLKEHNCQTKPSKSQLKQSEEVQDDFLAVQPAQVSPNWAPVQRDESYSVDTARKLFRETVLRDARDVIVEGSGRRAHSASSAPDPDLPLSDTDE